MRKLLATGIVFIRILSVQGQTVQAEFSYDYLYNKQWDRLIQTYNESRPFLEEKQPLFQHGMHVGTGYTFPSVSRVNHGIQLGYSLFLSGAENDGLENRLLLHSVTLNYQFVLDSLWKSPRLYCFGHTGVNGSGVYRRINGEPFIVDEKRSKAWGIGASLEAGIGYHFPFGKRLTANPFASVHCLPGFYFPGIERVVNQTQGLVANDFSVALAFKVGIRLQLAIN